MSCLWWFEHASSWFVRRGLCAKQCIPRIPQSAPWASVSLFTEEETLRTSSSPHVCGVAAGSECPLEMSPNLGSVGGTGGSAMIGPLCRSYYVAWATCATSTVLVVNPNSNAFGRDAPRAPSNSMEVTLAAAHMLRRTGSCTLCRSPRARNSTLAVLLRIFFFSFSFFSFLPQYSVRLSTSVLRGSLCDWVEGREKDERVGSGSVR
mmetsp:Transcript_12984/g.40983  ORF Transcript_12984/g.40983 Transcript_12984/m.40983 type:complete len:206 (+) Transcript_12984:276-893(+)